MILGLGGVEEWEDFLAKLLADSLPGEVIFGELMASFSEAATEIGVGDEFDESGGQGVDVCLSFLLANITWRSDEVIESDELDRLRLSGHG